MTRRLLFIFIGIVPIFLLGQRFNGILFIEDKGTSYLNQVFITNLTAQKTVLADPTGRFSIPAKVGDVLRFTSIITERKDLKTTQKHFSNNENIVILVPLYFDIGEVVVKPFKPSKNITKDVLSLKVKDNTSSIKKAIGLPEPTVDADSVEEMPISFQNAALSGNLEAIYDIISGERKKKERLRKYNIMKNGLNEVKQYLGVGYFKSLGIPEHFIDNFLQFVYSSENILPMIEQKNYEALKDPIDKYLPIYKNRLKNSKLLEIKIDD